MKNHTYLNKKELISLIAGDTMQAKPDIERILHSLEHTISHSFLSLEENESIEIKLFDGLKVYGEHIPEFHKENSIHQEKSTVKPYVRIRSRFTDGYKNKIKTTYRNSR